MARFLNNQHDIIDDRIDLVTRGLLGLTVACARCHDHKFDPIPAADYYSLYGIFASSDEPKNEPSTLRLVDRPQPVEPVIFLRGNPGNRGPEVPRRFLSVLAGENAPPFSDGSGRLELAAAITSPQNPLTGRVAANRVWMQLWGRVCRYTQRFRRANRTAVPPGTARLAHTRLDGPRLVSETPDSHHRSLGRMASELCSTH